MSKAGARRAIAAVILALALAQSAFAQLYKDPGASVEVRVSDLLERMTLEEKIGQMTQVARDFITYPEDIKTYGFGSILSGGGSSPAKNTPEGWADMIDSYQRAALDSRLGIPILYGVDAVHGHNNVRGAVIFPHNIGLGATRSREIVRKAARITALEMRATGARWNFAPCVAVPQDPRWGRTYEGFGSDPELVAELGAAAIAGYQEGGLDSPSAVLATVKHFAADGATERGMDRGDARIPPETLRAVHLRPYMEAIGAGAMSVMASYNSINGIKCHGNKDLLTGLLRGELGFKGFLVSDFAGVRELPGASCNQLKAAVNAGVDMVMLPNFYSAFRSEMLDLVKSGEIPAARVDEAARRILTVKFRMGLFEKPFADRSLLPKVGSKEHRQAAREAVQSSLVLLKNERAALPISPAVRRILVTGPRANDLGSQCGGWTISWQGGTGKITEGTTILDGMREVGGNNVVIIASKNGKLPEGEKPVDLVVLVLGETPYAESKGDKPDLSLSNQDKSALNAASALGAPVALVLISGRPLVLMEKELARVDALVAAWLPGTEGAGVADVLFGRVPFRGKLPSPWPRNMTGIGPTGIGKPLYTFGWGLKE